MRAESSCFGFEALPADGLFFAVFPDARASLHLETAAQQLCVRHRLTGPPLASGRSHISLLGFGAHAGLPQGLVATAMEVAATIPIAPFDVTFDRAVSFFGRPRPLVLSGHDGVGELIAFQQKLRDMCEKKGLGGAKRQFMPHVTLLYDERGVEAHAVEPIGWTVREFVLVHSLRGKSRYSILGRWPLGGPLSLAS